MNFKDLLERFDDGADTQWSGAPRVRKRQCGRDALLTYCEKLYSRSYVTLRAVLHEARTDSDRWTGAKSSLYSHFLSILDDGAAPFDCRQRTDSSTSPTCDMRSRTKVIRTWTVIGWGQHRVKRLKANLVIHRVHCLYCWRNSLNGDLIIKKLSLTSLTCPSLSRYEKTPQVDKHREGTSLEQ